MKKQMLITIGLVLFSAPVFADAKTELDTAVKNSLNRCITEVKACRNITDDAAGVLVFPKVTKGGIGVAYESGKGALIENGVTTGYYTTNSASLGATLGVGSKSIVVALRTPEELAKFKKSSNWEAGLDAGVAMLDAGTAGSLDTSSIREPVVAMVFGESGVLADVSIKGSKISPIDSKEIG